MGSRVTRWVSTPVQITTSLRYASRSATTSIWSPPSLQTVTVGYPECTQRNLKTPIGQLPTEGNVTTPATIPPCSRIIPGGSDLQMPMARPIHRTTTSTAVFTSILPVIESHLLISAMDTSLPKLTRTSAPSPPGFANT